MGAQGPEDPGRLLERSDCWRNHSARYVPNGDDCLEQRALRGPLRLLEPLLAAAIAWSWDPRSQRLRNVSFH